MTNIDKVLNLASNDIVAKISRSSRTECYLLIRLIDSENEVFGLKNVECELPCG